MRLLINGLAARSGGAQTYLLNIVPKLVKKNSDQLLVVTYADFAYLLKGPGVRVISPSHKPSNILARVIWERYQLPKILKNENIDIYYAPSGMLGCKVPKSVKTVVAFRNMLPFSPKEMARFSWGYNKVRYMLLRKGQSESFRMADLTIFISHYAKGVIDQYVPHRRGQSVVIPHGVDEVFRCSSPPPSDCRLVPGKYLLYVSPVKPYKAQLEVIDAWWQFLQAYSGDYKLVFAGVNEFSEYSERIRARILELGLEDSIIFLGHVEHQELPSLYQHSRIIIFASSCENCPNILIESLNSGRPVLCSNIQPMPEFGSSAVEYFDPYQPKQLANLLGRIVDNSTVMNELAFKARQRGRDFSWDKSVATLKLALNGLSRP